MMLLLTAVSAGFGQDRPAMPLDGVWEFRFAPDDRGAREGWQQPDVVYPDRLRVPGSWDSQGVGPRTARMNHNAVGVGWYRRTFTLPPAWKGRRVWLVVGGAHRRAVAWVNGARVASSDTYPLTFRADITSSLRPGGRQTVVIQVDSRRDPRLDPLMGSFDTVDFMDVNWGGLFEGVRLEATGDAWIEEASIQPDPARRRIAVSVTRQGAAPAGGSLTLDYAVRRYGDGPAARPLATGRLSPVPDPTAAFEAVLPGAPLWTPENPRLLTLELTLRAGNRRMDRRVLRFGLRRVEIRGRDFLLNGEPFFLRGYGDDWNFPTEIAGPGSVEAWKRYLQRRKAFGFNGVRHHSCMPPESYLAAADEVGILVQPELPIAYMPFFEEAQRAGSLDVYRRTWEGYIRQMRNHPSVFAWCMGNELPDTFSLASELYRAAKQLDPTRPVIATDGLFTLAARPFLDYLSVQFQENTLPWGATRSKYRLPAPLPRPVIVHEMGNLSVLPDPAEIPRYTGGVRPFWLEEMAERVKAQGLEPRLPAMLTASRRLQADLLKLNIEAARLSPDVRGYHQWLFRDYWAQSSGFVNQFDDLRALTPCEARRFNAPAVLLWDRDRASGRSGEVLPLRLFLSDYRPASAPPVGPVRVKLGGETLTLIPPAVVNGRGLLGPWTGAIHLPAVTAPHQMTLRAKAGGIENEWPLRVFPAVADPPAGGEALVVRRLTPATLAKLEQGAPVLLTEPEALFPTLIASFKPAWWKGDEGDHTYGHLLMPHPVLRGLSEEGSGGLALYDLMNGRPVVLLDDVPGRIEPIAWCLDLPWKMRRKAYLFEAQVGQGRLLVSSFNLSRRLRERDPAAGWLYGQLARYVNGPDFQPVAALPADWLRARVAASDTADLEGAVEGFARVLETTEGMKPWHSYRENDVEFYPVRQTDGKQRLVWQTAPAPAAAPGRPTVTFAWAGGMGWESEPGGGAFSLVLNGSPVLDFPFSVQSRVWRSADGAVFLRYIMRRRLGPDSFGLFLLTLPADRVVPGQPLTLAVTATAQNSQRWFGLNAYTDVAAEEQ